MRVKFGSLLLLINYNPIGTPFEDIVEEEEPEEAEDDGEVGEEDEMADFIVDEEFDETGTLVRYFSAVFACPCLSFFVFVFVFNSIF